MSLFFRLGIFLSLLLLIPTPSQSAVSSIDLGSEWIKVAVVNLKPGQSPISVAINEMSKRKSPALVAFQSGNRLIGEEAAGIVARYPDKVYSFIRDMIGKPYNKIQDFLGKMYLPYNIVEDSRGTATIRFDDGTVFSLEELEAMTLSYAIKLAEFHSKVPVKDAVIAVPPYFGQAERRGLLTAAQLAGVNVLALINEHSGAALQYGIDKDFSNGSRHVVFYDMGSSSTYAALVYFSAYNAKEYGKTVSVNQFQVKDVSWDPELGGQNMEMRLVEYFADEFNKQVGNGVDVRKFPKAMAKLKKQVKRTKEILSANTAAPISVESIYDDRDFRYVQSYTSLLVVSVQHQFFCFHCLSRYTLDRINALDVEICFFSARSAITREKFEELCEDLWERSLIPVKEVLKNSGLKVDEIYAVELIGGATRVPKLQAKLQEFLGRKDLDRHLDADEAIVLGAALHAANLSDGIKLNRKLGMVDGSSYGLVVELDGPGLLKDESTRQLIVPRMKKLPTDVQRSIIHDKDFDVSLSYEDEDLLPPGVSSPRFAQYVVSGLADASAKYSSRNLSSPIKANLHFSLSRSGILSLDRADAVIEITEWIEVPKVNVTLENSSAASPNISVETSPHNASEDSNENLHADGGIDNTSNATENQIEKTVGPGMPLSKELISEAKRKLEALDKKDAERRRTAELKNNLEGYIYTTKEKLESSEELEKISTTQERQSFIEKLDEVQEWLYTDGEDATAAEFQERLDLLKSIGDPIFFRLNELTARPAAMEDARKYLGQLKQVF
ncbi:Heat shock 70 kDa protein 17 [Vitis vinifera]|uniref:Heat shock 70 kDa protein 17 n=1 Tax=Vitis vinifera TaxID=29760 RepID=A0A438CKY1_VITVI|nr:Heat shock 70 kDa protein 17 [Vitis vinifera]